MKYAFRDLVDLGELQALTDDLYRATRIPSSIISTDGEILTGSGWQRICTDFHRGNAEIAKLCVESDTRIRERIEAGAAFAVYDCPMGLVDASAPICIDGEHVANVFTGQFLVKPPDEQGEVECRARARRYGLDEEEYIRAFREVPVNSAESLPNVLAFLTRLSRLVADLGLARKRELESEEERRRTDRQIRQIVERTSLVPWELDLATGRFTYMGSQALAATGRPASYWTDAAEWAAAIFPEDRDGAVALRHFEVRAGRDHVAEYRVVTAEGGLRWIEDLVSVISGPGGPEKLAGFMKDVTSRKDADHRLLASEMDARRLLDESDRSRRALLSVAEDQTAAVAALRESERRFRSYFELPLVGICITSPSKSWIEVNDRLCGMLGYSRHELESKSWVDLTHPDDLAADVSLFDRVLKGELDSYSLEKRFLRRDGGLLYADIAVRCVRKPDRTVDYFVALIQDVTARKVAEAARERTAEEVAAQKEILQALVEHLPAGVLLMSGPDLVIEAVNPAGQAFVPGRDLPGRRFEEAWPEAAALLEPVFRRVLETGEPADAIDERLDIRRSPDGPAVPAWFSSSVVRVRMPGVEGWSLLVTIHETTALVEAKRSMESMAEMLAIAQKAAGAGMWDWDVPSGELTWSPEFFQLFGLDPARDEATFETWRSVLHPDDREEAEERIAAAVRDRVPLAQQYRIVLPSGEHRWVFAPGRTIYGADGTPLRMSGICIDVTERVRLDEELKRHREHLEELVSERTAELEVANRELESFAYSVSHDLRGPLRAMAGFGAVLLEDYGEKLDEEGRGHIARIRSAAGRMSELINGLLDLSRVTRRELVRTRVDLGALAREVSEELTAGAAARTVDFEIQCPMIVHGDEQLLRSALQNLIGNALKFSSGRARARIEIGRVEAEGEPEFFVRDNGAGFESAHALKLFQPFHRLHSAEEFPGLGIGLATVQRIVARHGGRVRAEGRPGEGATFYFTLGAGGT